MPTTIEAVYEDGGLRLLEPLQLPEGKHVKILVIEEEALSRTATKNSRTPAEILAEIANLTVDGGVPETGSIDHNKILYGTKDEE